MNSIILLAATPLTERFYNAFIKGDRWKLYLNGLGVTVKITIFAAIVGIILGMLLALMRLSKSKKGKGTIFSVIATAYVDIIRGTPSVLQLMIMYFVILKSSPFSGTVIAIISFGINSSAYVCEIIRAGILAVDSGQMEAGRSLGLSKSTTMIKIIIPQAIKNVLPPLCNEFIVLMKETAIVGYVALADITRVANQIGSRTLDYFPPLIIAAIVYFVVIKILSLIFGNIERSLRKNDNR